MIATIAGEIIGSPYVNNPRRDSTDIFFPLFTSSQKVEIDGVRARMRTYQAKPGDLSRDVAAVVSWMMRGDRTKEAWEEVAEDRGVDSRLKMGSVLASCVPVLRLSGGLDEALRSVSVLVSASRPAADRAKDMKVAMDFTRFASELQGNWPVAARAILEGAGYDLSRNCSELAPFLAGTVVQLSPGRLAPGDGKIVRDPELLIPAVWAAVNESGSWEEAVRRGVALGGDSALAAALAGGVAELRWEVPGEIVGQAKDYLSAEDRELVQSYDRLLKAGEEEGRERRLGAEEGRFSVIRMEGAGPVYVIPEDRPDMEDAVRRVNRARGMSEARGDYAVIRPEQMQSELSRLSVQADASGKVLDGTYVEHPRPEVRHLWLQDGELRSATTRTGEAVDGGRLPAVSTRQKIRNDFEALKAYAGQVRTTLESRAGFSLVDVFSDRALGELMEYRDALMDGEGWNPDTKEIFDNVKDALSSHVSGLTVDECRDQVFSLCDNPWMDGYKDRIDAVHDEVASMEERHLHFASAFYPVVGAETIEIRQGDTLRARVGIDDDGRFRVDTNAMTGGVHTEGIDGVLATMNLVPANADMDAFRQALDAFCMDEGRIEDEEERVALEEDDAGKVYDEARAVRRKYASNVDRAIDDMGLELAVAVSPAAPVLTAKAAERREERRAESEERYAGLDRQGALDSQAHKGSVFTIGHSNLAQEEFDALLKRHGIEVLVDVRSYPRSKYCPHFDKDSLSGHLESSGVEYHYFPELGGHQFVGEGKDRRELSYDEVIATKEFQKGLKSVRDCAREGYRVALMCSENDPMDCHRMLMLGRALAHPEIYDGRLKPVDVQHITRTGYCLSQEHFERKLLDIYPPSLSLDGDLRTNAEGVRSGLFLQKLGDRVTTSADDLERMKHARLAGGAPQAAVDAAYDEAMAAAEKKAAGSAVGREGPTKTEDPLQDAYRQRSAVVQEKGREKGVSLKRNMMSRQAGERSSRQRPSKGGYGRRR